LNFELDTNGITRDDTVVVALPSTSTPAQIAEALAAAINGTVLGVTARSSGAGLQLLGPSSLTTLTSLVAAPSIFTTSGEIGTSIGFGIGIPTVNGALAPSVTDGQVFTIRRGASLVRTFELDFGNGISTPGAIPVLVGSNPTIDAIAGALVRAIGGAGLGLDPQNLGQGRVSLGGDANYALDVSQTGLVQLGVPGQTAPIAVSVPIDATIEEVAAIYQNAIDSAGLPGVSVAIVGERLILNGIAAVSGLGSDVSPVIRDMVGNLLQSNRDNGRTELTIFVGGGFNFGNAPSPYPTLLADNGPRHEVDKAFSLGDEVFADADAVIPGGSSNDGVAQVGNAAVGTPALFTIDVNSDGRAFYVDAWIDWNRNGVFEASEVTRFKSPNAAGAFRIIDVGLNTVSVNVPAGTTAGSTWGRFRLSEVSGLGPVGEASSGEVEDIVVLVQANPYQNPINTADVNKSGSVTPLDALNVINLLAENNRQGGGAQIPLNPPPAFLPDLVSQRFLADVNGSGTVSAIDALLVINEIQRQRLNPASEGESSAGDFEFTADTFIPVADGLLASPLTVATELTTPADRQSESFGPAAPEAESTDSEASVFDSPNLVALDDLIDDLATDRPDADSAESVDAVFAGLGLGL
jgi:hypothetical protein